MIKEIKGITLIALIITIILLLILAGVTIGTLSGNNGIFKNVEKAKKQAEIADIKEQIQIDILSKLTEGDGDISDSDLREILDKYGDLSGEENISDNILTTDKGKYEIKVSDIWNGTVVNKDPEGKTLAKDILKVNPTATEAKDKSPYVRYNGMDCRVLYNDDIHGVQIITENVVEQVWLGNTDSEVTASDFTYDGSATVDENFLHAAASYNNAIDTLNNKAKSYLDSTGIAIDARCLGSIPTLNSNQKFQGDITSEMWSGPFEYLRTYGFNGKFKNSDTYYLEDSNQLKGIDFKKPSAATYLASRYVSDVTSQDDDRRPIDFSLRTLNMSDVSLLTFHMTPDGVISNSFNIGPFIMPVFLLSPNAIVTSGDGSSGNPYVLGIK